MNWARLANPFSQSALDAELEQLGVRRGDAGPNYYTIVFPSKPDEAFVRKVDAVLERHDGLEQDWVGPEWSDFFGTWIVVFHAVYDPEEE